MSDPLKIEVPVVEVSNQDLVFLGCSYTFGTNLPTDAVRYSTIVSQALGKNEINLSRGGMGNYRSFDLFGQLDLTPGASVVLQLSELSRVRWYNIAGIRDRQLSINPDRDLLSVYTDKFLIYDLVRQLRIIVNYCRAQQVNLVIWSNASLGNQELDIILETYLTKFPEYVFLTKKINQPDSYRVDNALDGEGQELGVGHPGTESNKIIAQRVINHYNKLYDTIR